MISHDHRCIFVHPPRVGGSSIEHAVCGQGWWAIDPSTKHLFASQARALYSEYWDEYFKFAFVRNPWDRCVSLLHCGDTYYGASGDRLTPAKLDWYKNRFGYPVTLEYDYRFYERDDVSHDGHGPGAVFGNFIDEPLDFIGRYENLEDDFAEIAKTIGLEHPQLSRKAGSTHRGRYHDYYTDETRQLVADLYRLDCERFGYAF